MMAKLTNKVISRRIGRRRWMTREQVIHLYKSESLADLILSKKDGQDKKEHPEAPGTFLYRCMEADLEESCSEEEDATELAGAAELFRA